MSTTSGTSYRQPDLGKICRLCLTEDVGTINIFDSDSKTNVPFQIMACTALELHTTDSLPKQMCWECRIQLERSYYFRKRCQISDAKLRKHTRLINAGKKSRVFEPKTDEDDDDDDEELKESENFLKQIENDEQEKRKQRDAELEEATRKKLREEEMDRIFEEAKNFFISKLSNKMGRKLLEKEESSPMQPSTSAATSTPPPSEEKNNEQSNPVFEEVVDSTEISYSENVDEEQINKNTCYMVKVGNDSETEFEIQENPRSSDDTENLSTFTVVNVHVDGSQSARFGSLNFKDDLENNDVEMEQNSSEYNEDQVTYIDENSSNQQIFTIANVSDVEQDADQQTEEINIDLVHDDDEDEEMSDQMEEVDESNNDHSKVVEYLEDDVQLIESDEQKPNRNDRLDLIEVNKPQNAEEVKIFKCPDCPQAFTRRAQLARHASVHQKVRGFQCDHCNKWFACKSSLDRHRRIHTGEKPFKCDICNRRFIQKEILKRHLVIHTGERPFPCPHCYKSFVQRQMLTSHINLKHTENPVIQMHECFLCSKSFCHASGLSRHLLTHTGVSYTCKKCGKKFSDKSAVKRHTSSVHC